MATNRLSPGNIAQAAFDDDTESIKVSIIGGGTPTLPSNVQLSDGTGNITSTVVGSDRALDVNVINSIELTIDQADDSIALGDGSGLFTSTIDGTKRALDVSIIGSANLSGEFTQAPTGATVTIQSSQTLTSGETKTIVQYTIPSGNQVYVQKAYVSADCVGKFTVYKNSTVLVVIRLSQTTFFQPIDFATNTAFGIPVSPGDVIKIDGQNVNGSSGTFDATIQTMNT